MTDPIQEKLEKELPDDAEFSLGGNLEFTCDVTLDGQKFSVHIGHKKHEVRLGSHGSSDAEKIVKVDTDEEAVEEVLEWIDY